MTDLTLDHLIAACHPGGAATLTSVTELEPAEGEHGGVAPARFVDGRNATYAYEVRYIDRRPANCVLIDGKASQLNRAEDEIVKAIADDVAPLSLTPRIEVSYGDHIRASDLTLPHRLYDAHIRSGKVGDTHVTSYQPYIDARNATPSNARAILELAPTVLAYGGWDSTRKSRQGRYRSALTGEIIGELADQSDAGTVPPKRGGARVDSIAASVRLTGDQLKTLRESQRHELSPNLIEKIDEEIRKAGKSGRISASTLGLGAIPPALTGLGLVACRRIIRSHVLSFSALRQLRFNSTPDGDVACRALLAAYALAGLARADAELNLRANCNLREASDTAVRLDARHGNSLEIAPLTIEATDALLADAIDRARRLANIRWEGQVLEVTGDDLIINNADAGE